MTFEHRHENKSCSACRDRVNERVKVAKVAKEAKVAKVAQAHKDDFKDMSCLKITFLDHTSDPGRREDDYPNLKRLEGKWMANLGCLYSMDRVHGANIRDDAKPKQHWN